MNTTSSLKRSIAGQSGNLAFFLNLVMPNTSGTCTFGTTGNGVEFRLTSGKIYDNQNYFIYSYNINQPTLFSGNIAPTAYDLYINGNPIFLGRAKTSGVSTGFFLNPNGMNVNYDLFIKGIQPSYSINALPHFISGNICTGTITNNNPNLPFRILSGSILESSNDFSVSGWSSGDITNTGYVYLSCNNFYNGVQATLPFELETNWGTLDFDMKPSGSQYYSITINPTTATLTAGNTRNYTISGQGVNGVEDDLTSLTTLGTSNASILTVDSNGLVSGVSAGTATLTANFDVHIKTLSITVS